MKCVITIHKQILNSRSFCIFILGYWRLKTLLTFMYLMSYTARISVPSLYYFQQGRFMLGHKLLT